VRDAAADVAAGLEGALAGLAHAVAGAALGWLVLGVVLHLANQVARGRGWYAIVRAATEPDPEVRRRDAIAAWVAGAGAGGVASGRGGDAVRVLLLARRAPRAGCPLLAGTLVAEGAGELATGAVLLALALAIGVGPALGVSLTTVAYVVAAGAAAVGAAAAIRLVTRRAGRTVVGRTRPPASLRRRRFVRMRGIAARVGRGCAPLGEPGAYVRAVLPWQLASRAFRLAAIACFLAGFGLPATPEAVLLVAFAQGSTRILPFAPASVGTGAAMLAATFGPVTGTAVPAGELAAFFVGTSAVLTVVGTALALAICLRAVRWRGALDALRLARRSPARA
jgi:Lysylphosphatidylglycerol synthase TM region